MWAFLLFLISLLVFVGSLVCLFFLSLRKNAKWVASASLVAMIVAIAFFGGEHVNQVRWAFLFVISSLVFVGSLICLFFSLTAS